jgi:glycosyltransferase involved in cell wall biosynthesis
VTGLALFDDFTDTVLGHHPDFIVGLANAAPTVTDPPGAVRLYCPPSYLSQRLLDKGVTFRPTVGRSPSSSGVKLPYSRTVEPGILSEACWDAAAGAATVFVNCYFDENYPAWPGPQNGLRYVHSLHRPGYFAGDAAQHAGRHGRLPDLIRGLAPTGLFVVHSRAGEQQAAQFVDPRNLLRTGWPTASREEIAARFDHATSPAGDEPYVLSIGSARGDKGIQLLLSALAGGPPLRIVGQQYEQKEAHLRGSYPNTRVEWETGWVSRQRLGEAIAGAAVIVFPYLPEFGGYGGASGALAQALTFGKPVIVSEVLADQVPDSPACRVIPAADEEALRQAIDEALRNLPELHAAAAELRKYADENHTYEGHLEQILDRCG